MTGVISRAPGLVRGALTLLRGCANNNTEGGSLGMRRTDVWERPARQGSGWVNA